MLITRVSQQSGVQRTKDIPVTEDQITEWKSGTHIQRAMPNLSDDDREFIMTGIVPEEWNEMFPPEEETKQGE